jgi:hypothetical protein
MPHYCSSPTPGPLGYDAVRDLKWSPAEKVVARKAFDLALRRELEAVIIEAKKGAENPTTVRPLGFGTLLDRPSHADRPPIRLLDVPYTNRVRSRPKYIPGSVRSRKFVPRFCLLFAERRSGAELHLALLLKYVLLSNTETHYPATIV